MFVQSLQRQAVGGLKSHSATSSCITQGRLLTSRVAELASLAKREPAPVCGAVRKRRGDIRQTADLQELLTALATAPERGKRGASWMLSPN